MPRDVIHNQQLRVPPGLPAWITAELIEQTIIVWQPYHANPLTVQDAVDIMQAAGQLFQVLACEDRRREVICCVSSGQQSRTRAGGILARNPRGRTQSIR